MANRTTALLCALLGSLPLLLLACGRSGPAAPPSAPPPGASEVDRLPPVQGDDAETFISDVSGQSPSASRGPAAEGAGGAGATAAPAAPGANDGGFMVSDSAEPSAQRAISEADIIQLDGDRLFALSQYSGLTVVDIADPARLKVAGRHQTSAIPFEMYRKGTIAYVMLNGYTSYEFVEETQSLGWVQTARLQVLDVRDPANIRVLGDHEIPGDVSDSRMVGDVLYLVTFQNGSCWGCEKNRAHTRISSFDVSEPARFTELDALSFDSDENSWGPRSITVTPERMYVGGRNWSAQGGRGSIQVVDISDPSGALELGTEISIAGQIGSRWQMDEYAGVLRVISQNNGFAGELPAPWIETFRVRSAHEVSALGATQMRLPRAEQLQSVRFDAERAYAITFERIDPLFTIDLSDPAAPVQAGELEIPGFVYHMEPRGDRVYGLGFDQTNTDGGMNVSVFDVADIARPTMLDRVNFGAQWAERIEDQDRIHKAFNLLLDQGLILVPFAGGQYDEKNCNYSYRSGIQIIELAQDDLTLRGQAPQLGTARRSILRGDTTLFGVSDDSIQSFDIADRDAPHALDKVEVARNIESMHLLGDRILRFGHDWWTDRTLLDFTTKADANAVEPQGEIDLSKVAPLEENQCNASSYWGGNVLVHGDTAYLTREQYSWNNAQSSRSVVVYVLDIAASNPEIVNSFELAPAGDNEWYGAMVLTDSTLLIGHGQYNWSQQRGQTGSYQAPTFYYDIYSLEDPHAPRFIDSYQVPELIASRGWGWGVPMCGLDMGWGWWYGYDQPSSLVSGDILVSQHEEKVRDGQVKYFMDRLDVSDPSQPRMLDAVNIPGKVVHYDHESGLIVTLEEELREDEVRSHQECYWRGSVVDFDFTSFRGDTSARCRVYDRVLNTLQLDGSRARRVSRLNLDEERNSASIAVSGQRIHVLTHERKRPSNEPEARSANVRSFAVGSDFALRTLGEVELAPQFGWYGGGQLVARGDYAFIQEQNRLNVIDTTDADDPKLVTHDMPGWYCSSLQVDGDHAWCSMGKQGVMRFDL